MLKYKYIFHVRYTEAILSNSTRKLLWFEITEVPIAVLKITLLCHLLQFSAHFSSPCTLSSVFSTQRNLLYHIRLLAD